MESNVDREIIKLPPSYTHLRRYGLYEDVEDGTYKEIGDVDNNHAIPVKIKFLNASATHPLRMSQGSVGYDVTAAEKGSILPGTTKKIPLGFAVELPLNRYWLEIKTKSSHAILGLQVVGGIIDNDYTGELYVVLYNGTNALVEYDVFSVVAQLVIRPMIVIKSFKSEEHFDRELITSRGVSGFGLVTEGVEKKNKKQRSDGE